MHAVEKKLHQQNKAVDTFAVLDRLIEFAEGSKLISCTKKVLLDHRVCLVDINLEYYFNNEFSHLNKINHVSLDSARKFY